MRALKLPKKSRRLVVYVSDEQLATYQSAAQQDVRVLSDWVRLHLDRATQAAGVKRAVGT